MNIVILDGYTTNPGDLSWDFLRQFGEVTVYDRTKPAEIVERCKDAQIVVTNKTPLTKTEIDQMPKLQFVALLSTGYNVVDGAYLREKGIPLSNIPSYSTNAVAQLVFAFLTAFCNRVAQHSDAVRAGEWSACADFCFWKAPLTELSGKTLGIIGFGKIGQKVADIAEAFDMRILASSGHETDQSHRKNFLWATTEEIAEQADFITLHCPLTPQTQGLVNAEFLARSFDGKVAEKLEKTAPASARTMIWPIRAVLERISEKNASETAFAAPDAACSKFPVMRSSINSRNETGSLPLDALERNASISSASKSISENSSGRVSSLPAPDWPVSSWPYIPPAAAHAVMIPAGANAGHSPSATSCCLLSGRSKNAGPGKKLPVIKTADRTRTAAALTARLIPSTPAASQTMPAKPGR